MRATLVCLALVSFSASTGCSKLKSLAQGGGEGGAAAAAEIMGSALPFASGFEGEVGVSIKGHAGGLGEVPSLVIEVKGDKFRVDLPAGMKGAESMGGSAHVIMNKPDKKLFIVMDAQKQAIVIELDKAGDHLKAMSAPHGGHLGAPAPTAAPPKVTKTGKMDTVAGYSCENWEIDSEGKKGVACIAQQGASWFHLPITGIPTEHAWMAELIDGKHFPLRFVSYAKDGTTEEARIEVTRIDKKPLAAARFEVPADYKVVDLAQMMQGLGSMPGMPAGMPHPTHRKY